MTDGEGWRKEEILVSNIGCLCVSGSVSPLLRIPEPRGLETSGMWLRLLALVTCDIQLFDMNFICDADIKRFIQHFKEYVVAIVDLLSGSWSIPVH